MIEFDSMAANQETIRLANYGSHNGKFAGSTYSQGRHAWIQDTHQRLGAESRSPLHESQTNELIGISFLVRTGDKITKHDFLETPDGFVRVQPSTENTG